MLNKFNNNLMKKYSLLTVLIIIFSCNSKMKETKDTQIGIRHPSKWLFICLFVQFNKEG